MRACFYHYLRNASLTAAWGVLLSLASCKVTDVDNFVDPNAGSAPQVETILPDGGSINGDTALVINGAHFTRTVSVYLDDQPCTQTTVSNSGTLITCLTPAHAAGSVDLKVVNSTGGDFVATDAYTYQPAPTLNSILPNTGYVNGGTSVAISGTGFNAGMIIALGGNLCQQATVISSTLATCLTPANSAGVVDLSVQNADGQSAMLPQSFTYTAVPILSSISPSNGPSSGGTLVVVQGAAFQGNETFSLGGSPCLNMSFTSNSSFTCSTSVHAAGTVDGVLESVNGQTVTLPAAFTFQSAPSLSAISPGVGSANGGTQVTLTGGNFLPGATVTVGGVSCAVQSVSTSQVICSTGPHAAQVVDVAITNPDGQNSTLFASYTYAGQLSLNSVYPSVGTVFGGTAIILYGVGFETGATVTLGGTACASIVVYSSTQINCTTPIHLAGSVNVVVTNPDTTNTSLAAGFTFATAPYVGSISNPNAGSLNGGTAIQISGSGFLTGATVQVGNGVCTGTTVVSSTQINCTTPSQPAGPANVTVINPDSQYSTLANAFVYNPAPTITAINPPAGATTGGTVITITGTGFLANVAVTTGGVTCVSPQISSTQITCSTGSHGAGITSVVVTNYDNQNATLPNSFTYEPGVTVNSVTPSSGSVSGGSSVTVTGTGFLSGATVSFGGSACGSVRVVSSNQITCVTPGNAAGTVAVTVTNRDAQSGTLASGFSYQTAPTVVSISPNAGPLGGGQTVTVSGSGFLYGALVNLGSYACNSVNVISNTQLSCTTAADSTPASVTVTVTNPDAQYGTLINGYAYQGPPSPTSISPTAGPLTGGNTITIYGSGFLSGATIAVGGNACTSAVIASTQMSCKVQAHVTGNADVVVTNPDGQVGTLSAAYTYESGPTVSSVFPVSGNIAGGTTLLITGTNFLSGASVKVDTSPCTSVNVISSTQLSCVTPGHAPGGVPIQVTNSDSQSATLSSAYTYNSAPFVTSVSPSGGALGGGTTLSIVGSGFIAGASVWIGSTACTNISVVNSTQITCSTPGGPAGTDSVTVTNLDTQTATLNNAFTYEGPPTFTRITPAAGSVSGGTQVTIVGTGFIYGATVTIGGAACSSALVSATQIICSTALHASGRVNLVITNPDSQSVTGTNAFTYQSGPTVTSVSPTAGPLAGGNTLTVNGTGFLSNLTISAGSQTCTSPVLLSSTSAQCTLPGAGAGAVAVTVTNTDLQSGYLNSAYTYEPAPAISYLSPTGGSINGNSALTITGTGFLTGATVTVGSLNCPVTSQSSTQLICTTPAHALGAVNVTVTNQDTQFNTSANSYTYESGPTLTAISPKAGPLAGGTTLTLTGTGFLAGATVTVGGANCPVSTIGATTATCVNQSDVAGTYDVVLTNYDLQNSTLSQSYTYEPAPTLTAISVPGGLLNGGTSVTLTGTGFVTGITVSFGTSPCTVTALSATSITCTTSAHAAGTVSITATNVDLQSGSLNNAYTYRAAPTLTSISPKAGALIGGGTLTLTGTGFVAGATVTVGTNACTNVNVVNSTSITCTLPGNSAGAVSVTVTNVDTQYATLSNAYTYQAAPTLTSLTPVVTSLAGGITLTLTGTGFVSGASVKIGGNSCTSVNVVSSTTITCVNPEGAAGTVNVTVTNADTQTVTLTSAFTYQIDAFTQVNLVAGIADPDGYVDGTGSAAKLLGPTGITYDSVHSYYYVVDYLANTIRRIVPGTWVVSTVAGSLSYTGNTNASGSSSRFTAPQGITTDGSYLYVADTGNQLIRMINLSGYAVTTLAGSGAVGASDGVGTAATFNNPTGICYASGYVYVTDSGSSIIRQIQISTGQVTTIAGQANTPGFANGTGTAATFNSPTNCATDGTNLFVSDAGNYTIRQIVLENYAVTTLAGGAGVSASVDGSGTSARFTNPRGLTLDGLGDLYVADSSASLIREVVISTGSVTTVAGWLGYVSDIDGSKSVERLYDPTDLVWDGTDVTFVELSGLARRYIPANTDITTVVSTTGALTYTSANGTSGRFDNIAGAFVSGSTLYFTDSYNQMVREMNVSSYSISDAAGTVQVAGGFDGSGTQARFSNPMGMAVSGSTAWIADSNADTIRSMTISGATITTIAGSYGDAGSSDGTGAGALFNQPRGVAYDGSRYLYVADYGNNTIRKLDTTTNAVVTIAGTAGVSGTTDATGSSALFNGPSSLVYVSGYLYIADKNNNSIRKLNVSTKSVVTFAGVSGTSGSINGTGTSALFSSPVSITSDGTNLYVADSANSMIRKIVISSAVVTTLLGSPTAPNDVDGVLASASTNTPKVIFWDPTGLWLLSDSCIRIIH